MALVVQNQPSNSLNVLNRRFPLPKLRLPNSVIKLKSALPTSVTVKLMLSSICRLWSVLLSNITPPTSTASNPSVAVLTEKTSKPTNSVNSPTKASFSIFLSLPLFIIYHILQSKPQISFGLPLKPLNHQRNSLSLPVLPAMTKIFLLSV